jgi:GTP-binding protein Era
MTDILSPEEPKTKSGFVAIIGAPNAGKSTLLNTLIGQKLSITSPKPQTTRMRMVGVLTEGATQICLIDTPGIFLPKVRLDRAMVQAAWGALEQADAIVLLVDAASARKSEELDIIIETLQQHNNRVILALNKVDKVDKNDLLPLAQKIHDTAIVDATFMISGMKGDGVDDLKRHLAELMPENPWYFPDDQISDLPSQLIAAEMTREQLYRQLQQELPYAATVVPESWETKADGSIVIRQHIIIARAAHRPIVLGKQGSRIKSIGEAARKDIAEFMECPVHLFLEIKLDEKWQDRREFYAMFGLEFGK